jgi:arylsulfatase A-like enzyme
LELLKIFGLCPVLIFSLVSCRSTSNQAIERPNIVIFLTDDQGWGDLSLTGNTALRTPHIDSLAFNGALFEHFYVCPVCSPTRAELLTGRYHVRGGVYDTGAGGERLDLDEVTFAEILQTAGYVTAAFGKWHNGMQYPYHPNARGFDEFYGFCSGHWGNYFDPVLEHNGILTKGKGYIIDDLTDMGINFIESNKNKPFLLYLPYNTPHSPMQVPERWWNRFKEMELPDHRYNERENPDHTRAAYAMCENIDWNVGRVMNKLKEIGLEKNTIVIYLSDNGPNGWRWNGGMEGIKGSTDEGGVRSPFLIQWEGRIRPGTRVRQIASSIDLFPTIIDMAGIPGCSDTKLDGISLKPLLFDEEVDWEARKIFNYWNNRTSVRDQQYRLDHQNRLFDMAIDPGQLVDISEQLPDVLENMIQAKEQWELEVLSELPERDMRPFPVGHPEFEYTQLPARDGIAHGNIQRSNRWPNCSFFTNWTSVDDKITWDVEVLSEGEYESIIYYTCTDGNTGSTIELSFGDITLQREITEVHDPPLIGMENDRVLRTESYVKDFKPLDLGTIYLEKSVGQLTLRATEIRGKEVIDFRLMMLRKLNNELH